MRVGLLTPWHVEDETAWSGMISRVFRVLSERVEVVPVSTADTPTAFLDRAIARGLGAVSKRPYLWEFGIATSRARSRTAGRRIAKQHLDVVIAAAASVDVAYLGAGSVPVVQIADATFEAIRDFYPMFTNLHPLSSVQAARIAERSTRRTAAFLATSSWAAESLTRDYSVDARKVTLAPLGAAIEPEPGAAGRAAGSSGPVQLLLVASDWERKGGDLAVAAVSRARETGIDARLTVVGASPELPEWVARVGRVPLARMADHYARSDVLIELTTANAAGVTLTDAAAFGLPVIATDIGGVSTVVRDGRTGFLVSSRDPVGEAAAAVGRLTDAALRARMGESARAWYEERLSWEEWAKNAVAVCASVAGDPSRPAT